MAAVEPPQELAHGAYGLRVAGLEDAGPLLMTAPPEWAPWTIRHRSPHPENERDSIEQYISADSARLLHRGGGWVEIDRGSSTSTLVLRKKPTVEALVHPYLGLPAGVSAHWRGWLSFHAGALILDGRAWGVLGEKGAGKSSLLAWASQRDGLAVSSDDLLIVDEGGLAMTGPRCIDLRSDSAEALGLGRSLGAVGGRPRWRILLGDAPAQVPLAGWIGLSWDKRTRISRFQPADAFAAVVRSLALKFLPRDAEALMELVALPAFGFSRPRDYLASLGAHEELIETLRAKSLSAARA